MTWVAPKKKDCTICDKGVEVMQAIHEALWEGRTPSLANREYGHRTRAYAVFRSLGGSGDIRIIDRHRNHVEWSARNAGTQESHTPIKAREVVVYASDFVSVTDRMAQVGMQAADQVAERMAQGALDDKALVGVMQTGLRAVEARDKAVRAEKTQSLTIQAIFGVAGGYLAAPEQRVIEGSATNVNLLDVIVTERQKLKELQQG